MTEPEYAYVKGKGWVLGGVESCTVVVGLWRLTGHSKKPDKGDYYWLGNPKDNLEYVRGSSYWQGILERADLKLYEYATRHSGEILVEGNYTVLQLELL